MAHDGIAASVEVDQQLASLERSGSGNWRWAWLLVVAGFVLAVTTAVHGSTAYAAIARIDVNAKIATPNPIALFQEVATNGPRVGNTVETSSRSVYTRALEQFVLDGTGVSTRIALIVGGLFVRAKEGSR